MCGYVNKTYILVQTILVIEKREILITPGVTDPRPVHLTREKGSQDALAGGTSSVPSTLSFRLFRVEARLGNRYR